MPRKKAVTKELQLEIIEELPDPILTVCAQMQTKLQHVSQLLQSMQLSLNKANTIYTGELYEE
jgi:hypothetical protein